MTVSSTIATASAQPGAALDIRPMTRADTGAVLDLLKASLGESATLQRSEQIWNWKHEQSPFGASHSLLAVDRSGKMAGLRALLKWEFESGGQTYHAVRAVDTATHPDYRRMGVFTALSKRGAEDATKQGVDFIFNTPNGKSGPGYLKMGWQEVGLIEPVVLVLSWARFIAGITRARLRRPGTRQHGETDILKTTPPAFDEWSRTADVSRMVALDNATWGQSFMRTKRTDAYMAWRYGSHPTVRYRVVSYGPDGAPQTYAIVRPGSRFGLNEVVISELLVTSPDGKAVAGLIKALRAQVRADYLIAYFPKGSFHRAALERCGFRRAYGQGMTFVFRPLNWTGPVPALSRWGLSLGDLEFF